jgi:hypothetical protein
MFSFNTCLFVLVLAFACNAVASQPSVSIQSSVSSIDAVMAQSAKEPIVVLGDAEQYVILAQSGISTTKYSIITGSIAVSPIAATAMTGFNNMVLDSSGTFSTASEVSGQAFAPDYSPPTPAHLTTAVGNMGTAYTDAAGRLNPDSARINLGGGILGGASGGLTPGVYTFGTDVVIESDIYFEGSGTGGGQGDTDVFIIQLTGSLIQAATSKVVLSNGALAKNIFWQVAGKVVVGAGAHMEGILLVKTDVLFVTGSSLNGRALAQTACNLQSATITEPPSVESSQNSAAIQPSVSVLPSVSIQPSVSILPSVSIQPSVSILPSVSMQPSISMQPSVSIKPSVSILPSVSNQPSVSIQPSVSVQPSIVAVKVPIVLLGDAEKYVILAQSGISTTPYSSITGDIAVSPIAATAMTGFSNMALDSSGTFSTASEVSGQTFAPDYSPPTPAHLTTAVGNMGTAYNDAAARLNPDAARINLGGGILGGDFGGSAARLTPGVYTFVSDVVIESDIYFEGSGAGAGQGDTDVFIIQLTGDILQAANSKVHLSNGALAKNIFWQVAGKVVVGAGAHMEGILLVKTDVLFETLSSMSGRVLSQTACNLQSATITELPSGE